MPGLDVSFPCPKCGTTLSFQLAEIVPGHSRPCTSCGEIITFAGEDASQAQKIVDQLGSQFANVSVEVKVETRRPWWKFWAT